MRTVLFMGNDITTLLREWPYEAGSNVRIITADDGRSILQVRQPLGIEQYELDGRPDAARVGDCESVVDHIEREIERYRLEHGNEEGYSIDHETCQLLQSEGILYYSRYLLLFQISDFRRVVRDTGHNLTICRLLERHCRDEDDKNAVLQFKPYILRMNTIARAMERVREREHAEAVRIIEEGIDAIGKMEELDLPAFQFERVRSVSYLRAALEQLTRMPDDQAQTLRDQLEEAVREEDYERAARLRDRLRELS